MNVKAILKLDRDSVLFEETTRCFTEIVNNSEETLANINPKNFHGSATIMVTNTETGERTCHAKTLLPEPGAYIDSVLAGDSRTDEFQLSSFLQFSSCGIFELSSRYEWEEGEAESEPIRLAILPSNPQSLLTATTRGSQIGDIYCVWINKDRDGNSLYLSKIDSTFEPKFESSDRICSVVDLVNPFISFPANTIPTRQYIAWISGTKLNYVIHNDGQFQSKVFELDADDYEIIPPLLEDPFFEGVRQLAEVLLLKKRLDVWQMRIVLLGESPSFGKDIRQIKGVAPQWFQTVYRSSGDRYTFVLLPQSRDGNPYVKLAMASWKPRIVPAYPVFLTNWQGNLVAADVLLAGDDRIVGAGLVKQQNEEKTEYVIQKWSVDKNNELQLNTMPPLLWDEEWTIEHLILRVNGEGTPFILLKGGPEGKWFWVDGAGEIISLGELSSQITLPANIIFVSYIYPALLYTDKTCGLKLHYLGPKRVYRPPT